MAKLKQLLDPVTGEKILPVTSAAAVYDKDGVSIETMTTELREIRDGLPEELEKAKDSAKAAAQSAKNAADWVENVKEAMENLPDGQAVSAQVAKNAADIDTLCENVDKLNEESPRCINSSESDLLFSDENGNVIASFHEGHFKTKEFDSKKVSNIVELFELREPDKILPLSSTYVFRGKPVHGISGHFDATGQDFIAFCVAHEGAYETDHTIHLYLKYGNDYKYSGVFNTSDSESPLEEFIAQCFSSNTATEKVNGLMSSSDKKQLNNLSYSVNTLSERVDDVKDRMVNSPKTCDEENKFSICDAQGNVIAILNGGFKVTADGRIITKGFDSANLTPDGKTIYVDKEGHLAVSNGIKETLSESADDEENIFSICDKRGNVIAILNSGMRIESDGTIITNNFNSSNIAPTQSTNGSRSQFPIIDYHKKTFRWLDIGNSHSLCALAYLRYIAISQGVDLSNVAFCRMSRGGSSFNSWYNGYHDNDVESGDALTGSKYTVVQDFGELKTHVKGTLYNATTKQTESIDKDLTRSTITFYGTDTSVMRSLLKDNEWDLITIHQRYAFNDRYDESDGWLTDLAKEDQIDNVGNSSCADKFVQILKTLCPQSAIGYLFSLTPFGINDKTYKPSYNAQSLQNTIDTHNRWCNTMKKFMSDSGVSLMIPCDSALQNLRVSNIANEGGEDIVSRFGFNYDEPHTNNGVSAYTMAAVAWEVVFAPRFNKSIYGNTLTELPEDDLHSTTAWYVQPSYTDSNGNKVTIDASDGAWNKPQWVGKKSTDGGTTWSEDGRAKSFVRVSESNRKTCQMAAILAVNNMWEVINPQDKDL